MEKLTQDVYHLLGIRLTPHQVSQFTRYEQELLDWNARFNLTAIREPEAIRTKHFLDSLTCVLAWRDAPPARLIDIGTGAGFPGLALKILYPDLRLTLVESIGKKAEFCRHVAGLLGMEKVEVLTLRAEEIGQMAAHRQQYDWAVARAVASLPILAEYLLPLVRMGGGMLAQKGETAHAEAQASENAMQRLGGRLRLLIPVHLPGVAEDRYLVLVDKVAATPAAYPRRVGVPAKKPL